MPDQHAPYAVVVDDEPLIRLDACDILDQAGFRCLDAPDAEAAIDILERHVSEIALLFSDVDLGGGMNGFALATIVSQRWPDIGILVASGASVPAEGQLPDGAVFIRKPFSADVVHNRIREILPDGKKPAPLRKEQSETRPAN